MFHGVIANVEDLAALLRLRRYDVYYLFKLFKKVNRLFVEYYLVCFDFAHIQNIGNYAKEVL